MKKLLLGLTLLSSLSVFAGDLEQAKEKCESTQISGAYELIVVQKGYSMFTRAEQTVLSLSILDVIKRVNSNKLDCDIAKKLAADINEVANNLLD